MSNKLLLYILSIFIICPVFAQNTLQKQMETIARNRKANIGVAVLYDGQELTTVNNRKSYPMLSTFKFPLALAVLNHLDRNDLPLETEIFIEKSDLLTNTYSPLREARPEGNFNLSVAELLQYTVSQSDNNTCDILIKYIGGMDSLQQYIHRLGIQDMTLAVTEDEMHQNFNNAYLNHTRPYAAAELIEKFLQKGLFRPVCQDFLEKIMIETSTGINKLRAGLSANTVLGHKTGSSDRNAQGLKIADNDMGFVRFPNGKHYSIAVFVSDSYEDDATNAAIIGEISKIVYEYYSKKQLKR